MSRIALANAIQRSFDADHVIVAFRITGIVGSAIEAPILAGDIPAFLIRSRSPFATDFHLCRLGSSTGYVSYPSASDPYLLTAEQRRELETWLDRVLPGWEDMQDSYGNPVILVTDAAPQMRLSRADQQLSAAWGERYETT